MRFNRKGNDRDQSEYRGVSGASDRARATVKIQMRVARVRGVGRALRQESTSVPRRRAADRSDRQQDHSAGKNPFYADAGGDELTNTKMTYEYRMKSHVDEASSLLPKTLLGGAVELKVTRLEARHAARLFIPRLERNTPKLKHSTRNRRRRAGAHADQWSVDFEQTGGRGGDR